MPPPVVKTNTQVGLCSTNRGHSLSAHAFPPAPGARLGTGACARAGGDVLGNFQEFYPLPQTFSRTPGSALAVTPVLGVLIPSFGGAPSPPCAFCSLVRSRVPPLWEAARCLLVFFYLFELKY